MSLKVTLKNCYKRVLGLGIKKKQLKDVHAHCFTQYNIPTHDNISNKIVFDCRINRGNCWISGGDYTIIYREL